LFTAQSAAPQALCEISATAVQPFEFDPDVQGAPAVTTADKRKIPSIQLWVSEHCR
jgi:hypothetical protein